LKTSYSPVTSYVHAFTVTAHGRGGGSNGSPTGTNPRTFFSFAIPAFNASVAASFAFSSAIPTASFIFLFISSWILLGEGWETRIKLREGNYTDGRWNLSNEGLILAGVSKFELAFELVELEGKKYTISHFRDEFVARVK
jgi:hypothetical protein